MISLMIKIYSQLFMPPPKPSHNQLVPARSSQPAHCNPTAAPAACVFILRSQYTPQHTSLPASPLQHPAGPVLGLDQPVPLHQLATHTYKQPLQGGHHGPLGANLQAIIWGQRHRVSNDAAVEGI